MPFLSTPDLRTSLIQGYYTVDDDMRKPLLHTVDNLANAHRWLISLLYFCFYTTTTKTGHDVFNFLFPTLHSLAQINDRHATLISLLANTNSSDNTWPYLAQGIRVRVFSVCAASSTLLTHIARTVCQARAHLGKPAVWPRRTSNAWQPGEQTYVTSML